MRLDIGGFGWQVKAQRRGSDATGLQGRWDGASVEVLAHAQPQTPLNWVAVQWLLLQIGGGGFFVWVSVESEPYYLGCNLRLLIFGNFQMQ